jgi:hypothetical protein
MPLVEVVTAQGVAVMVAGTTVPCIGKHNIIMLIIANPVTAAFGFGQVFGFAAQSATGFVAGCLLDRF